MAGEISFQGFGPISQSNPTYSGGFGRQNSFSPLARNPINIGGIGTNWTPRDLNYLPWDIYTTSSSGSDLSVRVAPGSINGKLASNWSDGFTASTTVKTYFWVNCGIDGSGNISRCEIRTGTTSPVPQTINESSPPTDLNIVFGVVENGRAYNILQSPRISIISAIAFTTYSGPNNKPTNYYYWTWN